MSKLPKDVAIRVRDVKKDFHLPHHLDSSIKSRAINAFQKKDKSVDLHHALRGLDFDIKKGEFFGVIGRNGSGKSTLLKIISKIYMPTSGWTDYRGRLVAFIELGVGFNGELSGRDNVYLNAAMLGFSRGEIDQMYDEIVDFAELREFMDQKLKNYSSGMKVRLAFSVAIRAQADILILDEVLAVGDTAFKKKCYDYFKNLKEAHKTIVLVSHSMNLIRRYCDRAILIEDGKITYEGDAETVADRYNELFSTDSGSDIRPENSSVELIEYNGKVVKDKIHLDLKLRSDSAIKDATIVVRVLNEMRTVAGVSSELMGLKEGFELKRDEPTTVRIVLDNTIRLNNFYVSFLLRNVDASKRYGNWDRVLELKNNTEPSKLPVIMSGNIQVGR